MVKNFEILLKDNNNFALFRLPNEKRIKVLISKPESVIVSQTFADFNATDKGFLFAPYNLKKHSSILLQPDIMEEFDLPTDRTENLSIKVDSTQPDATYSNAFSAALNQLHENKKIEKLVLARSKSISTNGKKPLDIFIQACLHYPNAMVYWFCSDITGSWLGATPEVFISGSCDRLKTVALAGSKSFQIKDKSDLSMWDEKNKKEQKLVEEFLINCIKSKGRLLDAVGPFSFQAGHIAHLKSELLFAIEKDELMNFIAYAHPTPAICGLPQSSAKEFLEIHESFDRLYFSGLLGWLDPQNSSNLFVNLRCMNWLSNHSATLFAGSGLLPSSNLLSEWMETESKMETLKRLFD
ncbi:MAG: chorismate-binding protein [Paludibacteraceae bacterium]|jgi:isochorismate synthase|nr:chorismate-binding protein [Paludibacteraceae bacterium]